MNKQDSVIIILAVLFGAAIGGFVFNRFGGSGVNGFNLYSLLVATMGAVILLVIYKAITGRRA